ncbi:hypothetical protein B566_EDAN004000 [Ephemera danica]|nr:hypothetical protein B566_EDAN004000 [Ephemera danica]
MERHDANPRPASRFHSHHGANVTILDGGAVARRESSFANALTFSERPLLPGELFLLEIEQNERGWSGFLRLGLTQLDPDEQKYISVMFPLPQYALPDLTNLGQSWVYAVTKSHNNMYDHDPENASEEGSDDPMETQPNQGRSSILGAGEYIYTSRGRVLRSHLLPSQASCPTQLPTDVGSRVGLMYVPRSPYLADMHFVLNGEDQGPCCRDIPYGSRPLFAVVDVYGSTKQVRLVQLYGVWQQ